jgi:hypothetical protein
LSRVNPLIQALSLIVATGLLALAFLIGAVLIGVLLAVGAVAALSLAARVWWLNRKIRAAAAGDASVGPAPQMIEGEYTIVGETDGNRSRTRALPRDDARSRPRDAGD